MQRLVTGWTTSIRFPAEAAIFLFTRLALGPSQTPIQRASGAISTEKLLDRKLATYHI
jgi:hypothetical protein